MNKIFNYYLYIYNTHKIYPTKRTATIKTHSLERFNIQ